MTHRDPLDSLSEDELRALVALGAAQAAEGEAAEGAAPPDVPPDEGTPPGSAVH